MISRQSPPGTREDEAFFSSFHPGGTQFIFAEGSVQFLRELMDFPTYQHLADR
jgi:hypothetical protein